MGEGLNLPPPPAEPVASVPLTRWPNGWRVSHIGNSVIVVLIRRRWQSVDSVAHRTIR